MQQCLTVRLEPSVPTKPRTNADHLNTAQTPEGQPASSAVGLLAQTWPHLDLAPLYPRHRLSAADNGWLQRRQRGSIPASQPLKTQRPSARTPDVRRRAAPPRGNSAKPPPRKPGKQPRVAVTSTKPQLHALSRSRSGPQAFDRLCRLKAEAARSRKASKVNNAEPKTPKL